MPMSAKALEHSACETVKKALCALTASGAMSLVSYQETSRILMGPLDALAFGAAAAHNGSHASPVWSGPVNQPPIAP